MIVVIMGVAGCGKTTVGRMLAARQGWEFIDADDHHPPANIDKMSHGIPLQDEDRWPWLDRLNALLRAAHARGDCCVLACSALKQRYRERLARGMAEVRWIHLTGSFDLLLARLQQRQGHYMKAGMLRSQFEALEAPEDALTLDITPAPEALSEAAARWLSACPGAD